MMEANIGLKLARALARVPSVPWEKVGDRGRELSLQLGGRGRSRDEEQTSYFPG